ncbi:MAG: hypothetical protein PHN69_06870 [Candidatus Pacebacteria bacterium]|nr:hypothetical protein [Candidatus Paceibacterota bacterium]
MNNKEKIVQQIFMLVKELAQITDKDFVCTTKSEEQKPLSIKNKKGATGGIRTLVDNGYMDDPRILSEIIERLKQEGRHYTKATISMGLLSLVREKILIRFRDKGQKMWKYVIRK